MATDLSGEGDGTEEDQLCDLLVEWDQLRKAGLERSAEELCPDNLALQDRLRREIAAQKRLEARLGLDRPDSMVHADSLMSGPPEIPGLVVEREIGRGAMGAVYLAHQFALNRLVALKVILSGVFATTRERERFRTEALATACIPHPNIVTIHDSGESSGHCYLVLEYLGGGSLAERLQGEPQDPRWSAELVQTLAGAVAAAHQQDVIHRDLKPRNIVFTADGVPKITDYGLAKLLDADTERSGAGMSPGTPSYMAPEQASETPSSVGPAADIYALGAILYELLTGRPPFRGQSVLHTLELVRTQDPVAPTRLQPKVPRDLETVCLKCLQKQPIRRYKSAVALAEDIDRFLDGRPVLARRASPHERAWVWCKRNPVLAVVSATLVAVTLGGFVGVTWQWSVARTQASIVLEQRNRAEENLLRVFNVLDKWYTSFTKRPEIQRAELASLRKEFLLDALREFDQLARDFASDPRAKRSRVLALIRASEVHQELGEKEAAAFAIRLALESAESFLEESPNDGDRRWLLLRAIHRGLLTETDDDRALRLFDRGEVLYEAVRLAEPEKALANRSFQMLDVYNLGIRLVTKRHDDALRLFLRACEIGEPLLNRTEENPLLIGALAGSYSYIAELEANRSQFDKAENAYLRSNEFARMALERFPFAMDRLTPYLISCGQLQGFYSARKQWESATHHAREACRILETTGEAKERTADEILRIRRMLISGYHDLALQYGVNSEGFAETDKKRADAELLQMEIASRKTHDLSAALRSVVGMDAEIDHYDALSCFNLHKILLDRSGKNEEAEQLIVLAVKLMEASLSERPAQGADDPRTSELEIMKAECDRYFGNENQK